jgi:hypothetical protein
MWYRKLVSLEANLFFWVNDKLNLNFAVKIIIVVL